jgi:hypothetical protein
LTLHHSICDIQEKFRPAIHEYSKVSVPLPFPPSPSSHATSLTPPSISTTQKLLKAAEILSIPVLATTQNAARLGPICAELSLPPDTAVVDKTLFSMVVPGLTSQLPKQHPIECIIVGIETHICVTQTTLDLLALGHKVYVVADGVSSCNEGERGVALRRLEREGARVVSSEGVLYEVMGDAGIEEFKGIAGLVKEWKDRTKESVEGLCKI